MWSVDDKAPKYPVCRIFRLERVSDDTAALKPEVINGYSKSTNLTVVTANLNSTKQCDFAARIAQDYGRKKGAITIAVMVGDWETTPTGNSRAIQNAFNALFACPQSEVENLVWRLVRAVVSPGEPFHPWCTDWNDLRSTVGHSASNRTPCRYGFGSAVGLSAGTLAAKAALKPTGVRGGNVHAIAFVRGGRDLMGQALREVLNVFDTWVGSDSSFCKGLQVEPEMQASAVEVDFFYFGDCASFNSQITS